MWVHSNSSCKGQPNTTAATFCDWVNIKLLPMLPFHLGSPSTVESYSYKVVAQFEISTTDPSKGIYIDGHKHNDVVEYHSLYLWTLDVNAF